MKILVTGGLGLIGHNIVRRFCAAGHSVRIIDNKTDYGLIPRAELDYLLQERRARIPDTVAVHTACVSAPVIPQILGDYRPDILVHCASFPRQKVVNVNPQAGARVMTEGLLNLLEASVSQGVQKFVYISSSMVYGDFTDDVTEDAVCRPQGQYGIMKLMGEVLVRDYTRKHGLAHTIIRPSAVYGEYDVEDRVVSKFMLTALRGGTLQVNGPDETLDFTYVEDAATGIAAATVTDRTDNKTYNITKSHGTTLAAAAELAVRIAGTGQIHLGQRDPDFPSRGALNIDRARRDFGFDPQVDVAEGFQRYYDWFLTSTYWRQQLGLDTK